ncbi:MAG: GOLPH3/VPS74 family protein [Hyphomicrobiales bacterium]
MGARRRLSLPEEVLLLALRDRKGTVVTTYLEVALAGAMLAELLLDGRIAVEPSKKAIVNVLDPKPTGDAVLDEGLERLIRSARRASLRTWVTRLYGIKELRHKIARRLCERGILRADEETILLLFKRRVYPELDPIPEMEILDRLRAAIFTDAERIDARTVVLIALAHPAGLLDEAFGRKEVRSRRKRIERIVNGELFGAATREVIEACQAAVMVAVIVPSIAASAAHR